VDPLVWVRSKAFFEKKALESKKRYLNHDIGSYKIWKAKIPAAALEFEVGTAGFFP